MIGFYDKIFRKETNELNAENYYVTTFSHLTQEEYFYYKIRKDLTLYNYDYKAGFVRDSIINWLQFKNEYLKRI